MSSDLSALQAMMKEQIRQRDEQLRGTVISKPKRILNSPAGDDVNVWVCDVDIGRNKVLRRVVIKAGVGGSISYARDGLPVLLKRQANGKYSVIGPGDRVCGKIGSSTIDFTPIVPTVVVNTDEGFELIERAFSAFRGTLTADSTPPNGGLWKAQSFDNQVLS